MYRNCFLHFYCLRALICMKLREQRLNVNRYWSKDAKQLYLASGVQLGTMCK